MNRIIHKLKSRSGATIVFAMAVFVLVSIVSVSMITVPLNAAALGKSQQEAEQIRLCLSSAAGLVRDCIVDKTLSYRWEWAKDEKDSETALADVMEEKPKTVKFGEATVTDMTAEIDYTYVFPLLWREMTEEIAKTDLTVSDPEPVNRSVTITINDSTLSEKLRPVTADFTMDGRYNVTATFTVTDRANMPHTMTQFFGMKEETPYSVTENYTLNFKTVAGEGEGGEGEVKTDEVKSITYQYTGEWAISWPMENYRVNA